jgi:hypothetical protein
MTDCAAEFELLKQDLRARLASIELAYPASAAEIQMARYAIDEFCHFDTPCDDNALQQLRHVRSLLLMSLNSIWRCALRRYMQRRVSGGHHAEASHAAVG